MSSTSEPKINNLNLYKSKVFIDGKSGTTGLRIYERLQNRTDIELITLSEEERKDINCRKKALNESDYSFLCLPDSAAIEAVNLIENPDTVILDTSTAHRTSNGWAYGFPELSSEHLSKIVNSKRIAIPGCHASGFIALIYPLIANNYLDVNEKLSCFSLTGYSGGGKKMIDEYETSNDLLLRAPRQYGLSQMHKHLKEMSEITGLLNYPIFCPVVDDFYSGMEVTVPLFRSQLNKEIDIEDIKNLYKKTYIGPIVTYDESISETGYISTIMNSNRDTMKICVNGNNDRLTICAVYDNLGKGASGAAIECLNQLLNVPITTGLEI